MIVMTYWAFQQWSAEEDCWSLYLKMDNEISVKLCCFEGCTGFFPPKAGWLRLSAHCLELFSLWRCVNSNYFFRHYLPLQLLQQITRELWRLIFAFPISDHLGQKCCQAVVSLMYKSHSFAQDFLKCSWKKSKYSQLRFGGEAVEV